MLRLEVGDSVTLFDGSGAEYSAQIETISRDRVTCSVGEKRDVDRELDFDLHLAVALPKGDRSRWLVEKSVELGVRKIVPIECERSVVQVRPASLTRLEKAVVEASKQCGRNRLTEVSAPVSFSQWIEKKQAGAIKLIAHPDATAEPLQNIIRPKSEDTVQIAIGPEGGFTESEVAKAIAAGWKLVVLGNRRLRVETAALAAVAAIGLWSDGTE